jgi:hypothetical protein
LLQVLNVKKVYLVTLVSLILVGQFSPLVLLTADFPIGLFLVYEIEDEYFDLTIHATESYEVIEWTSPNNASFLLYVGYTQGGSWDNTTREVNYTSWEFTYSGEEFNETHRMLPLWLDEANWEAGSAITLLDINFTVIGTDDVTVQDSSISCWVLNADYIGANEWEYRQVLYYDTQYGILMMKYLHRWPGIDDYCNAGTFYYYSYFEQYLGYTCLSFNTIYTILKHDWFGSSIGNHHGSFRNISHQRAETALGMQPN